MATFEMIASEGMKYPATETVEALEERAGVHFPDPYRWLEQNTEQVQRWQDAQAKFAAAFVRRWPHFETLRRSVERFTVERSATLPRRAGGLWFKKSADGVTSQARAVVSESPHGPWRVVYDPLAENSDLPPYLSWISPSPDGRTLALGVCADGSENNTIRLIEVDTGQSLPRVPTQVLMDAWLGGAQWLADSSGFFYTALAGTTYEFRQAVYLHHLDAAPPTEPLPIPFPIDSRDYRGVMVSSCGGWAVAVHRMLTPIPIALLDLRDPIAAWRPFVTDIEGAVAGHVVDDRYIAFTDVNAPRGRIVAIPLDSATPNDPATWLELVPESEGVIRNSAPVGDRLYVTDILDTYARVRIFSVDGASLGTVSLPGKGSVAEMPFAMMNLFLNDPSDTFMFGFCSLTESWATYRHLPREGRIEMIVEPQAKLDDVAVEDHWARTSDGTRIPYHTVRRKNGDCSPQPTLLYAYGAAGVSLNPQFPGGSAAFVEAGGVFVHAHLPGGGEFGRDWWLNGTLKNRQKSYDALYAIAEDLITKGTATPQCLGVTGASAGGLMTGVAITQRPDLWKVAIPRVPILDLIGASRDPYGYFVWSLEYGDPEDPAEVRRVAAFSPYQLIKDDTVYPAVFVAAGGVDPRCPPWHARKFVARLQAAGAGENPTLLHIWPNTGHGSATAKGVQVEEQTEWLAFAMQLLGLTPR